MNTTVNGTKNDYYSNNPLYECHVCSRQVSSNRYATHLEKCMGMGTKTVRKGSGRTAKANYATSRLLNSSTARSKSPAAGPRSRKRSSSPSNAGPDTKQMKMERISAPVAAASTPPKRSESRAAAASSSFSVSPDSSDSGEETEDGLAANDDTIDEVDFDLDVDEVSDGEAQIELETNSLDSDDEDA